MLQITVCFEVALQNPIVIQIPHQKHERWLTYRILYGGVLFQPELTFYSTSFSLEQPISEDNIARYYHHSKRYGFNFISVVHPSHIQLEGKTIQTDARACTHKSGTSKLFRFHNSG